MSEYIAFWVAKALVDVAIGLAWISAFSLMIFEPLVGKWWRHRKCQHKRVMETMACDAVCRECGKNLGFIQKWRDAHKGDSQYREI